VADIYATSKPFRLVLEISSNRLSRLKL